MCQDKFVESRLALDQLLAIDPENAAALKQLRALDRRENQYRLKEKKVMKLMKKFYSMAMKLVKAKSISVSVATKLQITTKSLPTV